MSQRVTIVMDEDLEKKLRMIQAKTLTKKQGSYSFSRAVNDSLRKVL